MAPAGRAVAKKALAHSAPAGFVSSRKVRDGREGNLTRRRGEAEDAEKGNTRIGSRLTAFTKGRAALRRGRLLEEDVRSQGANGDEGNVGFWIAVAEDDVVEKRDAERFAGSDEAVRKSEVLVAWGGVSSGVVVRDDHALRPATYGSLEDFSGMDERPFNGAGGNRQGIA